MPHGVRAVGHDVRGSVARPRTGAISCSIAHSGQFVVCGQSRQATAPSNVLALLEKCVGNSYPPSAAWARVWQ